MLHFGGGGGGGDDPFAARRRRRRVHPSAGSSLPGGPLIPHAGRVGTWESLDAGVFFFATSSGKCSYDVTEHGMEVFRDAGIIMMIEMILFVCLFGEDGGKGEAFPRRSAR